MSTPRLCLYGGCRSYGKMSGYCLIHVKEANIPSKSPPVAPVTTPQTICPSPPIAPLHMTQSPKRNTTMQIKTLPSIAHGCWHCFVPNCNSLAQTNLPFCIEHEHATLTVDVKTRKKRKSPAKHNEPRSRPRLSPSEARNTSLPVQCDELYRQQMDVSEHAHILATLART
ncbi:hypothetical protein THRCLA_20369 [Thraustotheca clavata]|uniref:Uncharacterized protein n=1 Tax=Thraustotheca clavata TaxID=74557 RepID=A0A1W0A834_9STRA|nr:hypothetical protein THRCLA_20369 [Thraustotheca clavata]